LGRVKPLVLTIEGLGNLVGNGELILIAKGGSAMGADQKPACSLDDNSIIKEKSLVSTHR